MSGRLISTLVGLLLVALLAALRLADPLPVAAFRDIGFDFEQRALPRTGEDSFVRIIDVDEASLASQGQWPWPRSLIAKLTSRLTELGAASIGFDMLFPEPDRLGGSNDADFATALANSNSVLGFSISPGAAPLSIAPKASFAISGSNPVASLPLIGGAAVPLKLLYDNAAGLGSVSLNSLDSAVTVRRVPLLFSDGKRLYPGLSVEDLRLALGVQTLVALGDTAEGLVACGTAPDGAVGQVFNLGTGREISVGELAATLQRLAGHQAPIVGDPARLRPAASEVERLLADPSRAADVLGWRAATSLDQGLAKTVAWFRQRPAEPGSTAYVV